MELELHQVELRYEALRKRAPLAERQLLGSLVEIGQQLPIVVVSEAQRFILIDGYKRVRALKRLAHDTVRATGWQVSEVEALLLERGLRCASEDAFDQAWLLAELQARFGQPAARADPSLTGADPGHRARRDARRARCNEIPGAVGARQR